MIGVAFLMFQKKNKKQTVPTRQKPVLILNGPSDKLWFYLDPTHQQVGPVSYNAIANAFMQGTISQATYVWHENLTEWKKLEELTTST